MEPTFLKRALEIQPRAQKDLEWRIVLFSNLKPENKTLSAYFISK